MTRLAMLVSAALLASPAAQAKEYFIGGPVHLQDMEIVANYLVGVQMAPEHAGTPTGPDVIHIEADVHATADNTMGFGDGAWIPYLTIDYTLQKDGTPWQATGKLMAMEAKDGPHYANNVKMNGPGTYKLTYKFEPPVTNGFMRHTDKETGVPAWWKPFEQSFSFKYPQQ